MYTENRHCPSIKSIEFSKLYISKENSPAVQHRRKMSQHPRGQTNEHSLGNICTIIVLVYTLSQTQRYTDQIPTLCLVLVSTPLALDKLRDTVSQTPLSLEKLRKGKATLCVFRSKSLRFNTGLDT